MWWMEAKKKICGGFSTNFFVRNRITELVSECEKLNAGF